MEMVRDTSRAIGPFILSIFSVCVRRLFLVSYSVLRLTSSEKTSHLEGAGQHLQRSH